MAENYEIKLGISLDDSGLKDVKRQLTNLTDNTHRIRIDIDNSRLLRQVNHAKKELRELSNTKGNQPSLTVNTESLEQSFKKVSDVIEEVRRSLGTLDDKSGMQSLVASVNQIATVLGKASDESENLVNALNALSKKDFSINLGINMGGSGSPIARNAAYGNKVRSETLPQLKQQVESLVKYVNDYYKSSYNEFEALQKLVSKTKLGTGDFYQNFLFGEDSVASRMNNGSLAGQMQAFKQYIDMFKQAASLKGLNLDSVTSQFSKSADDLIKDAQDIQTGANETKDSFEKLKQVFGGGGNLNIEGLSAELKPIVDDLKLIREAIQSLSNGVSIDGITQSFNKLSETLDKLSANLIMTKTKLDEMSAGVSGGISTSAVPNVASTADKIEKESAASAAAVVQNEKKKQQALEQTADVYENTAQRARQTGKLISDSAQKAIDSVSSQSIDKAFTVNESDSIAFKREMENLVRQWTDAKGELTDIKINTDTFFDGDTGRNIEKITSAIVTYNNELGETIKKTIALRQIDTKQTGTKYDKKTKKDVPVYEPVFGFVEVSGQYTKSLGKTKVQTDKFVKQQKQVVANLTNQINQLNRAANDQNASRPIKDTSHLDIVKTKYDEITSAIQRMESASSDTFVDEQNNVKTLISDFKSLIREFRNAENASSQMKGNDYESGRAIAVEQYEKFLADAKGFAVDTSNLNIDSVTDVASLNKFTDALRVAKAELAKLKAEASSTKREIDSSNRTEALGIDVSDLRRNIEGLQNISPEIKDFKTEINGAEVSVESLLNSLSNINTQSDFRVARKNFESFTKAAQEAGVAVTKAQKESAEKKAEAKLKKAESIKFDIETGGFDDDISKIDDKFNRLSSASQELRDKIEAVKTAYNDMERAAGIGENGDGIVDVERLIEANERYKQILTEVNNELRIKTREERAEADAQRLDDDRKLFRSEIDNWLVQNSAASKKFGASMLDLKDKAESCDRVTLNNLKRQFKLLDNEAEKSGLKMLSWGDRIKSKIKEYAAYLSAAEIFMYAEQALSSMFEQVRAIDTAMTELKKVTNETDAAYNSFLSNASAKAKEIGTTIDGFVSSTADFARLGYSFKDAQGLAEVANIYAVVGDDIDSVETATQSLISTLTAFKDEANGLSDSDFALSIIDKMNEVGNNFAISSGGIGDALQRSASSMMAANNSLDETIALITAAM